MSRTRTERSFTLSRVLPAPRNVVFTAWTEPEHLVWFYNPAMPTPSTPIQVDLRVGGVWRQQMMVDDDLQYPTGGLYLEVVPNERLVFRWGATGGWPELTGNHEDRAPIVTVDLHDVAEGTRLELTVTFPDQLADEDVRNLIEGGTRDGWSATIDRVAHSTAIITGRLRQPTRTHDGANTADHE
ncbi:SRPBCC family protein [Cryobacterium algoritolerans]|nr:SRPBCC domain-containing protein [Cryobacterium algoritolerans]